MCMCEVFAHGVAMHAAASWETVVVFAAGLFVVCEKRP